MLGQLTENQHDAVFEAANLLMNIAFWYMKHSAMICAKEDLKVNYSNRSVIYSGGSNTKQVGYSDGS